jgi:YVTN family beta-propeller protein
MMPALAFWGYVMKKSSIVALLTAMLVVSAAVPASSVPITPDRNAYVPMMFTVGAGPKGVAVAAGLGVTANSAADTVTLFDACSPKVCRPAYSLTIPVGRQPSDVALWVAPDQTTGRVYVTNSGDSSMTLIPLSFGARPIASAPTSVLVGGEPTGVAVSPDGRWAYVSDKVSSNLVVYDTASLKTDALIRVGTSPWGVALSPDGSRAYVAANAEGVVSVVDTAARLVVATIPVGMTPGDLALDPSGKTLYVPSNGSGTVSVIDTATNAVTRIVTVGTQPWGMAVTGSAAFVANYGSGTVSVIDTTSITVVSTITTGANPFGVAVNGDQSVFVTNTGAGTLSTIAQRAPVPSVKWSSSRRAKTVTGSVPFMPAVAYTIVAVQGSAKKVGGCSVASGGAIVTRKVKLRKGSWRESVQTRLPWQQAAAGQQNRKFTF